MPFRLQHFYTFRIKFYLMSSKKILTEYSGTVSRSWKGGIKKINQFTFGLDYMSEHGINPTTALAIEYNIVTDNLNKMDKYRRSATEHKLRKLNLSSCSKPINVVEKCFHSFELSISETAYRLMIEELKRRDETETEILETIHEYASNINDLMDTWA